jgi:copper oxidase (laccase) domain-containing protein
VISNENTWDEEFHSYRRDREKSGRAAGIIFFNFFS